MITTAALVEYVKQHSGQITTAEMTSALGLTAQQRKNAHNRMNRVIAGGFVKYGPVSVRIPMAMQNGWRELIWVRDYVTLNDRKRSMSADRVLHYIPEGVRITASALAEKHGVTKHTARRLFEQGVKYGILRVCDFEMRSRTPVPVYERGDPATSVQYVRVGMRKPGEPVFKSAPPKKRKTPKPRHVETDQPSGEYRKRTVTRDQPTRVQYVAPVRYASVWDYAQGVTA